MRAEIAVGGWIGVDLGPAGPRQHVVVGRVGEGLGQRRITAIGGTDQPLAGIVNIGPIVFCRRPGNVGDVTGPIA